MILTVSSSKSRSRAYHHGNLRQTLLDAASGMLAHLAAGQLSLRELARAAGVSHAAPYHYFPDRAVLLKELGADCMRRMLEGQQRAFEDADDPAEALIGVGLAYIGFAAREPNAFALIFDPSICPPGNPGPEMAPLIEANERLLVEAATLAQRTGALPPGEIAPLTNALWGMVHGLAHLVMAGHLPLAAAEPALRSLVPGAGALASADTGSARGSRRGATRIAR